MKLLNSIKESAAALAISRARLYELISANQLVTYKLGHRTVVRGEELVRFVAFIEIL